MFNQDIPEIKDSQRSWKVNEREICFVLHTESHNQSEGVQKISPGSGSDMFPEAPKWVP